MKIKDFIREGDVVAFPGKKEKPFPERLQSIVDELPQAFQTQEDAEKLAKALVDEIRHSPEWMKAKWKNPYLMSQYVKELSPLETVLVSKPFYNNHPNRWEEDEKVAMQIIKPNAEEIIGILENSRAKIKDAVAQVKKIGPLAMNEALRPLKQLDHKLYTDIYALKELLAGR